MCLLFHHSCCVSVTNESQEADSSEESRESTDDNTALMTEVDQEQTDQSLEDVAE